MWPVSRSTFAFYCFTLRFLSIALLLRPQPSLFTFVRPSFILHFPSPSLGKRALKKKGVKRYQLLLSLRAGTCRRSREDPFGVARSSRNELEHERVNLAIDWQHSTFQCVVLGKAQQQVNESEISKAGSEKTSRLLGEGEKEVVYLTKKTQEYHQGIHRQFSRCQLGKPTKGMFHQGERACSSIEVVEVLLPPNGRPCNHPLGQPTTCSFGKGND